MCDHFGHLPDTLDEVITAPVAEPVSPPAHFRHIERCPKCNGTGIWRSWNGRIARPCFACKGKGEKAFATPRAEREHARDARADRKVRDANEAWEAFKADHAEISAWIVSSMDSFPFAKSMFEAVKKYGSLTEKQLAACQRCVDGRKRSTEKRAELNASAPSVSVDKIEAAFATAKEKGLKRLKLRIGGYVFSPAPVTGVNAGAVYVKLGHEYLGKIKDGKLLVVAAGEPHRDEIVAISADPKAAAIAHGIKTGECAICGRELTNHTSVERGIGPICAEKYGW